MRKAQITNFIMLGVILVIMVAIFFFAKSTILEKITPEKIIPPDFIEVNGFVEGCLKDVATDAIYLAGQQGGYVKLPNNIAADYSSYLSPIPGGVIKTPYWYYKGENRIPSLTEMELQIDDYVKSNLGSCIKNFGSLKNKFNITAGDIDVHTTIAEKGVIVNLYRPTLVEKLDDHQLVELDDFTTKLNINLYKTYMLARQIMQTENQNAYLEKTTIDLMVLDPTVPFTHMSLDCNKKRWSKRQVTEEVKTLLEYNLPRIKIKNSDYYVSNKDDEYEKNHFIWDVGMKTNLKIGLNYNPNWAMNLVVRPVDGDVMKGNVGKGMQQIMNLLCINTYHFTYDVEYPVMLTIRDSEAFSNKGYDFNFVIPVYINHNKPERKTFSTQYFRSPADDVDFCSKTTSQVYTFKAVDSRTNMDVEGVNISFDCVTRRCNLGVTKFDGNSYKLEAPLPKDCTGGFLIANGKNIKEESKHIFLNEINKDDFISIPVRETKKLKLKVFKKKPENMLFNFGLDKGDVALITLKDNASNYSEFKIFPDGSNNDSLEVLYDDVSYDLEVLLLRADDAILGGFKYKWNLSYDKISDSNTAVIDVLNEGAKTSPLEKQAFMLTMDNFTYPSQLYPELVSE